MSSGSSIIDQLQLLPTALQPQTGDPSGEWRGRATWTFAAKALNGFKCSLEGSFLGPVPHGEGVFRICRASDDDRNDEFFLRSLFVHGVPVGVVTFQAPGLFYTGAWSGLSASGHGSAIVSPCYTISGHFHKGELQGHCRVISSDFVYIGGVKAGKRTGDGICWEDGKRLQGWWQDDELVHCTESAFANGCTWSGLLDEQKEPWGEGVLRLPSGLLFVGTLRNGKMVGHGVVCDPDLTVGRYGFYDNGELKGSQVVTTNGNQSFVITPPRDQFDYLPIRKITHVPVEELIRFIALGKTADELF